MAATAEALCLGLFPARRPSSGGPARGLLRGALLAAVAAAAGAALGLVASPDPGRDQTAANLAWTTAAAVQVAQGADRRAKAAEAALAKVRAQLGQLERMGAVEELRDFQEAKRLGLDRALADRLGAWEDDRPRVLAAIVRESNRHGFDPLMVAAVIETESRFDPLAVSPAGAYGLMQLMPPTARGLFAGRGSLRATHLFDPVLNIELGTEYLSQLVRRFDGDLPRALIAYNAGPSVARALVRGSPSHRRLQAYPRSVLATYRELLLAQERSGARLAQG
ncbi:MAG TPA: lytic transglycosylase domain-containing protein [Myxococcales bacterium]|nr:lytic transglycosylase domain-containing protein [Myxococcales bacterium]